MLAFPSPTEPRTDRKASLVGYLEYFRSVVADRLEALGEAEIRRSGVPSGWTPAELAHHLLHVERRWLDWGFEGVAVADPWADQVDGRWHLAAGVELADLLEDLAVRGAETHALVGRHDLDEVGAPGDRWNGAEPATLERVLLHLVQEYARHVGHLDIVCELAGGPTGE